MLILFFRGIFLIGILSWYSTNVWKMIDGYFKDRFEKYLQREYEKNPKMRDDVDAYGSVADREKGKSTQDVVERSTKDTDSVHPDKRSCVTVPSHGEETCPINFASMEAAAGAGSGSLSSGMSSGGGTTGGDRASESEVIGKGAIDQSTFAKCSSVSRRSNRDGEVPANFDDDRSAKSLLIQEAIVNDAKEENVISKTTMDSDTSKGATTELPVAETKTNDAAKNVPRKPIKRKSSRRISSRESIKSKMTDEKENKRKKKQKKVKTIVLTVEDFREAKMRSGLQDYDFSEFDDDGNEDSDEPPEGILVSQLPFKPRADIGNLERVTDDEFCPLTLEDEGNCDETKPWP